MTIHRGTCKECKTSTPEKKCEHENPLPARCLQCWHEDFNNTLSTERKKAYGEWDKRWKTHCESAIKEGYERGINNERSRILKLIEEMREMDDTEYLDEFAKGFNDALDDLKNKLDGKNNIK